MLPEEVGTIARIRFQVQERLRVLGPHVGEAECLQKQLEIVEYAIKQRDTLLAQIEEVKKQRPVADKKNFRAWLKSIEPDEIIGAKDVVARFGTSPAWARNQLKTAEKDHILEKWGRGCYRLRPTRTGQARLHVVS